ncbi:MAG: hypothetical protein ABGX04_13210 [Myxococcales bacterium]|nr:hypothetical protein [Myxococcales bacterium]HIK84013.1 hypothetical protein [Myxococcales bacterium]
MSNFARSKGNLNALGPVLFGVAFLAPLIAQSFEAASLPVPLGLDPITFGLALGLSLGVIASLRGRWI